MDATVVSLVGIASVTEHYRFFQNKDCEYFLCHCCSNAKDFNCMFCYCPLYNRDDCGGQYTMLDNGWKDCSKCLIPHYNYDYVIDKLKTRRNENEDQ